MCISTPFGASTIMAWPIEAPALFFRSPKPKAAVKPAPRGDVTVTVYNGSGRSGLAAQAASGLTKAGFKVGGTGNADRQDYSRTEIRYGAGGEAGARAVLAVVPSATLVQHDGVSGVQLVLGSDFSSIEADNTSAFNCRYVDGTTRWSEHAYGRAIDLNPIENPYVTAGGTTSHRASRSFLRRAPYRPGMAVEGGAVVRAFDAVGWGWGGRWSGARDYQHFSASGR